MSFPTWALALHHPSPSCSRSSTPVTQSTKISGGETCLRTRHSSNSTIVYLRPQLSHQRWHFGPIASTLPQCGSSYQSLLRKESTESLVSFGCRSFWESAL